MKSILLRKVIILSIKRVGSINCISIKNFNKIIRTLNIYQSKDYNNSNNLIFFD